MVFLVVVVVVVVVCVKEGYGVIKAKEDSASDLDVSKGSAMCSVGGDQDRCGVERV